MYCTVVHVVLKGLDMITFVSLHSRCSKESRCAVLCAEVRERIRELLSAMGQSDPPPSTERQLARRFGQPELRIRKHTRKITGNVTILNLLYILYSFVLTSHRKSTHMHFIL